MSVSSWSFQVFRPPSQWPCWVLLDFFGYPEGAATFRITGKSSAVKRALVSSGDLPTPMRCKKVGTSRYRVVEG